MGIGSIGVVAAMPEEIAPLLRRVGRQVRREQSSGWNLYRFERSGVPVTLIESGMGPHHAAAATAALIELAAPEMLLNFGFAGAVRPGLEVGELVLAQRVLLFEKGRFHEQVAPDPALAERLARVLPAAGVNLKRGSFITAAEITNKDSLNHLLDGSLAHPALEMETAAFLAEAARAGLPAVALRGISDAAGEELGFSLEEFCDAELRIRLPRVLGTVLRKPWIIPQLIRLAGNTRRAGESLATGVLLALEALSGPGAD
jgi:adenosylhomocysteine nucleosidase